MTAPFLTPKESKASDPEITVLQIGLGDQLLGRAAPHGAAALDDEVAVGDAGDGATRLENRIGEPAANPYLYMASQIVSGLDGIDRKRDPGPSADTPYETKADLLPKSLREAVTALNDDPFFRQALGAEFVDYYVHIKNAEIERFQAEVSDWEHREYFEMF